MRSGEGDRGEVVVPASVDMLRLYGERIEFSGVGIRREIATWLLRCGKMTVKDSPEDESQHRTKFEGVRSRLSREKSGSGSIAADTKTMSNQRML